MDYTTLFMPFGKYRGERIEEIPENYLRWVLENVERLTPSLRRAIKHHLSMDATPNALSVDVTNEWYRRLAVEFHPDRGGSHEAMKAVNRGRDLLLELVGGAT